MPSWLDIPLELEDRVAEAFASVAGYEDEVPGEGPEFAPIPNPESKIDFAKRELTRYVKNLVVNHEVKAATSTAASIAAAQADTELTL